MSMTETRKYRVMNPTERTRSRDYNSIPYVVPAGGSLLVDETIAHHLKKHHEELELVPVEAHYTEVGSTTPAQVYACPDETCDFTTNEYPKFHDHLREHLDAVKNTPTPAGEERGEFVPVRVFVQTDDGPVPALQVSPNQYGKIKVRLGDGTEVRVPASKVKVAA